MWKRIGSVIRFAYDNQGTYALDSNVIMTGKELQYLCGFLNSKLGIKLLLDKAPKTGTGDVIISVQALEPLLVPPITPTNHSIVEKIEKLVEEILQQKNIGAGYEPVPTTPLEKQIDELVYQLYGLTDEEIKIVEGKE